VPTAPLRECSYPGCSTLVSAGRCASHGAKHHQAAPGRSLYATPRWRSESAEFLREHPLCECPDCQAGKLRAKFATTVDHREPHRGSEALFWSRSNWQAMSASCHSKKTAREVHARRRAWREVEG
jgi:5-methylcytosine-specific restriction protein A